MRGAGEMYSRDSATISKSGGGFASRLLVRWGAGQAKWLCVGWGAILAALTAAIFFGAFFQQPSGDAFRKVRPWLDPAWWLEPPRHPAFSETPVVPADRDGTLVFRPLETKWITESYRSGLVPYFLPDGKTGWALAPAAR